MKRTLSKATEATLRPRWSKRGFTVNAWKDPKGKKWAPHLHRVAEIVMPVEGEIAVYVAGKKIRPRAGKTLVIPPKTIHAIHNVGSTSAHYFFGFKNKRKS